ncbi:hypothetical protein Glove_208g62 [Diversispora epigaea]|uniref:Uncharacterized protein n=1 Tax=Diversispora epigaea TaxID=1348612 RepID=A0A397IM34_9GLOM|nr:hypothetical protein Glove_208g62 [Diversispora epigaea]
MNQTRIVFAALKPHVPLIKFIGPRSKVITGEDVTSKRHPAAPKDSTPSSSTTIQTSPTPKHNIEQLSNNNNKKYIFDYTQLPPKYKRKELSNDEIEAIEAGGANYILRN